MKSVKKYAKWSMTLLLIITVTTAKAQYPNTGDQTVCISSTEPYGVPATTGSSYQWSIIPLAGGNGSILSGQGTNLISINWTSIGTATLQLVETDSNGCIGNPVSIIVTINPVNTATLTSAPGTDSQTVCTNTAITNITYSTTGATGATFNGLPAGVTGIWSGNIITISGTPTVTGTFNYTITLTGGCGTITAAGTITVVTANTITLTSAPGTDSQMVCINTPIVNITYSTTGATGAAFSGLPAGVTGSWSGNVITISGTPTVAGTYNYTISLTGGCGAVTATGTITVNPKPVTSPITHN